MNFTDAVRELAEGRCEKIEKDGIFASLYMGYLRFECSSGGELHPHYFFRPEFYLADDFKLVGEKPQMGGITVKEWRRFVKGQATQHIYRSMSEASLNGEFDAAETTVTYFRPIPRKVKRREEIIPLSITSNKVTCRKIIGAKEMDTSMKFYREWEEEAPE